MQKRQTIMCWKHQPFIASIWNCITARVRAEISIYKFCEQNFHLEKRKIFLLTSRTFCIHHKRYASFFSKWFAHLIFFPDIFVPLPSLIERSINSRKCSFTIDFPNINNCIGRNFKSTTPKYTNGVNCPNFIYEIQIMLLK